MKFVLAILLGYILGCSSMSFYLMLYKKVDLRTQGSKNLGASNAMVVMGWRYGVIVALHDAGKALLAVLLAKLLFPGVPYVGALAGASSVLGHIFPFYLKFKGGKGFASYMGMTLGLNWKLFLILFLAVILITLITDYIVLGTTLTVLAVPLYYAVTTMSLITPAILCIATATILFKHRRNFVQIVKGTEIGLRSAHRGDHRAK